MRKTVNGSAVALMLLPCLAWGLQQVSIKAIAGDVSPMLQIALHSGVAAVLVWLFSRLVSRDRWLSDVGMRSGLVVGLLFALEFLFIAEGLRWTSASHMAVFLYTSPLSAAIGLHLFLPEERMTRQQWFGMSIAFAGIATTFLVPETGLHIASEASNQIWGDFLGLCAGVAWGMTTVAVRTTRLSEAPATQTLFYQLAVACVLLLSVALAIGQFSFRSSCLVWISLTFQTLIVSFVAYLMWFWLLKKYLAAQLGVLLFMTPTPLFGVMFGALLLDEDITPSFLMGALFVFIGVLLVSGRNSLRPHIFFKSPSRNNK